MDTRAQTDTARSVELTHLFIEALNARDLEGLLALTHEDVELRNPAGGKTLRGRKGLERIVDAAAEANVVLVRVGRPEISTEDRVTRIEQPVTEIAGTSRIHGMAIFETTQGRISSFEIKSESLAG